MPSILYVDGVPYNQAARKANSILVDAWGWDLDDDFWLEFHEYAAGFQPKFVGHKPVEFYDADEVLRFKGVLAAAQPGWSEEGRTWGYRCYGLKYLMNQLPVVGFDGSGEILYNLPFGDEDYLPSMSGKSVGDILESVFDLHAAALTAIGVAVDSTTEAQMAAMTLVPQEPVSVQGDRLAQALDYVLQQNQRNMRMVVPPDGAIRFVDVSEGTSRTLTLGVDPVHPPLFAKDWQNAYTRVQVRGAGMIRPARLRLSKGELVPAWDSGQQSDWSMADYDTPGDASDEGDVTVTNGPTSITIQSSDPSRTWGVNFWSKRQSWIFLRNPSGTGATYQVAAPVTSCTAMTAGGTSTLTLGIVLENSASDAWTEYSLAARSGDLDDPDDPSLSNVYRLFDIITPGGLVEDHLVKIFPAPVPLFGQNNIQNLMTSSPSAMLYYNGAGFPATFKVVPSTGQILFDRPVIETINQPDDLAAGGGAVNQLDEIFVLLAYSRGPLEAVHPPDVGGVPQYAGTAYTEADVERTYPSYAPNWTYEGNQAQVSELAEMLHKSMCDTVVEGHVRYMGAYTDVWSVGSGHKISIADGCHATGDESLAAPVRAVTVIYNWSGGKSLVETSLQLSTRRDPRTDANYYMHLSQIGSGGMSGQYFQASAPITRPNVGASLTPMTAAPVMDEKEMRSEAARQAGREAGMEFRRQRERAARLEAARARVARYTKARSGEAAEESP